MSFLSNLRLAVRLGLAFLTLTLGLVVVALSTTAGFDSVQREVDGLTNTEVRELELTGAMTQRTAAQRSIVLEHLYVSDGDLAAQDSLQKKFDGLVERQVADDRALDAAIEDAAVRTAFDADRAARIELREQYARAMEISREETVDRVEERVGSRELYVETIAPAADEAQEINAALVGEVRERPRAAHAPPRTPRPTPSGWS